MSRLNREIAKLSATEIVQHIAQGNFSATECTQHFLDSIDQANTRLNALITVAGEQALESAAAIDQLVRSKKKLGPLAGLPIAIKDGICTAGLRTSAGSRMLQNFVPPYDATIVKRLKDAGAIVIGKTNMDEFAMGSSTENSCVGPTLNPWSTEFVSGGSSGGSAACVAADLAPTAIGSDTGGSIRQPAAFCGVTGLKPTYGRVSRNGLIAFGSSLDHIGPLTRSAADAALILTTIAGHDSQDSTSAMVDSGDYSTALDESIKGLKIGVCREHFGAGLNPEIELAIREAIRVLADRGAQIVETSLPQTEFAVPAYYVIACCEASSNLARFDGVRYTHREPGDDLEQMYCQTRAAGFGAEVKRRIMLGTFALSSGYYDAYYLRASKVRRIIKQDYDVALESCDLILGPTTPTAAFRLGKHIQDPLEMYLADIYTVSANLAGVPAISVPCGFLKAGLPIGMQLQGRAFTESTLLRVAHQYQQQTDWHLRRPVF